MKTQLENRVFAPDVVETPAQEERVLNYTNGRNIKHVTKDKVTTDVRWDTFIIGARGKLTLDSQVKMADVQRRAKATGRRLVYVAP
jgi:hypothetical protein